MKLKNEDLPRKLPPMAPLIVEVSPIERAIIKSSALQLQKEFGHYESPEYITALHLNAYNLLPERIAALLTNLSTDFSSAQYGAIVFKGLADVDQDALGPTPASWKESDDNKLNLYGFISSLLHGAVPSKPVQYYVQRKGGGILHAIIPEENMSFSQTGAGSKTDLFVHTEDAFLYHPADFLSFLYLRNEEQVNSTLYSIRSHGEPDELMKALFRNIYKCPKDANFDVEEALGAQETTSVLYGNAKRPFIRFDAAEQIYNEQADQTPEALDILKQFWAKAKLLIYDQFIPNAGDLIFVNNHLCAHGRTAFKAGVKAVDGKIIPCERRQMLRMMSKSSLIHMQSLAHPENPFLIMEDHYGKVITAH
ncbi:taurine catabolism dioxygenase TauD [Pedobacter petrophilus]|uniref:Taurine catabolism dioxygenase TauD n=1 Tax=Pedobacter petrophilus TaxID=1908241 RepID=A0A7K0G3L2_9SPHI|nr:TauD/TfdA family dioxygenase [Pedobacter petrophilus]MRX78393.1 taurine catabolism dioxygenase TauD [Pedobacter petrophilus]